MKLLNLFSSQNTHSSFIFHETFSSNENTAESVDSLETSEDPLDTQEEFDEALEQLEKESISDLDKAANVISIFLSKIEASYEKNGATMSDAYRAQLSKILNNYSSHLAEARALAQKTMDEFEENHDEINDLKEEFNAEKENNPASRKTRRLQEKIGKLEARRDHAKAKARVIYDAINIKAEQNKTMLNSYASHLKLTPSTNEEGPLFEPSAEKVILKKKNEVGIPLTKNIEELNIEVEEDEEISLLPTETVKKLILEDKLSLGLKQLRENGKSYLNSNKDALIKLGVKTFNDSSGGNVEKGGLQGISELQSIIGASPDGIFGPKTKKALESFTAKEKMPPPTKAQYEASLRGYSTQETYDQHLAELAEREKEANTSSKINKKADSSEAKESATKTNVNSTEAGEFGTVKFNENIVKEVKEWPTVGETTLKITDINNDTYHLSLDKEGTPVGSDGFNLINGELVISAERKDKISTEKNKKFIDDFYSDELDVPLWDKNFLKNKPAKTFRGLIDETYRTENNLPSSRDLFKNQLGSIDFHSDLLPWLKGPRGQRFVKGAPEQTMDQFIIEEAKNAG